MGDLLIPRVCGKPLLEPADITFPVGGVSHPEAGYHVSAVSDYVYDFHIWPNRFQSGSEGHLDPSNPSYLHGEEAILQGLARVLSADLPKASCGRIPLWLIKWKGVGSERAPASPSSLLRSRISTH